LIVDWDDTSNGRKVSVVISTHFWYSNTSTGNITGDNSTISSGRASEVGVLTTDAIHTEVDSTRVTIIAIGRINSGATVDRVTEGPGAGTIWISGGTIHWIIVAGTVSANINSTDASVGTIENCREA